MTEIDVPDWVVEIAARVVAKNVGEDYDSIGKFTQDTIKETQRECLTAALGAWVVPQHQAKWIVEQCWEDITPEQFADLEETEAVTRILYDLRQEKPDEL